MHDGLRQHLQLKELAYELYVAQRAATGLVSGLLQLHPQALTFFLLKKGSGLVLRLNYDMDTVQLA